jgi:REP element-mobilizing transposase RayT
VKVEQVSIQHDHIHILIRTSRRSLYHHFFRVVAGQIAQRFKNEGLLSMDVTDTPKMGIQRRVRELKQRIKLWKYRPFSHVVRGYRAYKIVRNYIQLNEKEVLGKIKYQSRRLRGLSMSDWTILWA